MALDIDHPETLDDKIAYLAFRTDTTEWSRLADKIRVREYVEECGYGAYLPKLYGVWEHADQIDFEKLPDAFVIKANHASATNILVPDKTSADLDKVRRQLDEWLGYDYGYQTCQPHYSRIKPMILAEEYLGLGRSINDYKLFCINGTARFVQVMSGRVANSHQFNVSLFDLDWTPHPEYCSSRHPVDNSVQKPESFSEMVAIAQRLSSSFPFVRVDFYEIGGKPVFGEMTFTPGYSSINNDFNVYIGKELRI